MPASAVGLMPSYSNDATYPFGDTTFFCDYEVFDITRFSNVTGEDGS
jgi:hypothetical protein